MEDFGKLIPRPNSPLAGETKRTRRVGDGLIAGQPLKRARVVIFLALP